MKRLLLTSCVLLLGLSVGGCDSSDDPTGPDEDVDGGVTFLVDVVGERFSVRVTDQTTIDALRQRMHTGRVGVLIGRVVTGSGGFNAPWSWHLDPTTVQPADVATEVCDGRPSDVEDDLSYWVGTVKHYCPWGATIVSET